ncbi:MAG: hypothetical protein GXY03_05890 [Solirubrobacterales bacterium]|nr:hypothetical protein [Solirubrobacterales bacterium]
MLRILLAATLLTAVLAGSAYAVGAGPLGPGSPTPAADEATGGDRAASPAADRRSRPLRCANHGVRMRAGRVKRIRLRCVRRNRAGKVVFRKLGGLRARREIVVRPRHGRVRRLNQRTGRITYVPRRGFTGRDRFAFTLVTGRRPGGRGRLARFRGRVIVRVLPRRRPPGAPSCSNGRANVAYGGQVELRFQCRGEVTAIQAVTQPRYGRLGPIDGEAAVYIQDARQAGPDDFAFRAIGPGGASAPATMTVEIAPPPAPTCAPEALTTREDEPLTVQASCAGVDISYEIASPPSHGSLSDIGATTGQTTYIPSAGWFSPDDPPEPDVFQVTATNPGGAAPPVPISVTVLPAAPDCRDVTSATLVDTTDYVPLPCGTHHSEPTWEIVDGPEHGTLGPVDQLTGRVAYTPDPGYVSPGSPDAPVADTFTFRASNTGGTSAVATAEVIVVPPPPVCAPLDAEVDYETPRALAADCVTAAGAEQRYELVAGLDPAEAGTLDLAPGFAADGELTFTPAAGFSTAPGEAVTFRFRAVNSGGTSRVITAHLQVDEPAPTCDDYYATTEADQQLEFQVPCEELSGGAAAFSIVEQPPVGQGAVTVDPGSGEATFTPAPGYYVPEGGARVSFTYQAEAVVGGATSTGTGHVDVLPPAPTCAPVTASAFYMTALDVALDCAGPELSYSVVAQPAHGELGPIDAAGTVEYTPAARFAGDDSFTVTASNRGGVAAPATVSLSVREWQLRAIGDSVTAAFGFFGDGSPMGLLQLLDCKPPDVVNDRCSSNSADGPDYSGSTPNWTADYGLANDIAWPSQFSNDVQGGGHVTAPDMFRNQAVTGSAPADWLTGGHLNGYLADVIAEQPDIVTMTMGANPLLSDILLTVAGETCSLAFTVGLLRDCVQPYIDDVQLPQRLQALYTAILDGSEHTRVVIMPYHLAIPYANLYSAWQLEVMGDMINQNVAAAVAATKAALPADQANRLYRIAATQSPQQSSPQQLPRFNVGAAPSIHDDWSGSYDCHWYMPDVDGPSHQSTGSQAAMAAARTVLGVPMFCFGEPWILSTDTGIHPNQAGHAQFASTLENYTRANGLVPPLP